MAIGYTNTQYYSEIANAIREKTKTTNQLRPSEMAPAILSIQGGGASAIETTDPEELYAATRPTDWLTMPTESEINDDELYLLFHIPDGGSSVIAFNVECTGSYIVSLLASESHTEVSSTTVHSGSSYQAQLSSSDFGDLTSNGMKQALIKISGTNITKWEQNRYMMNYSNVYRAESWNIVEIVGKLPSVRRIRCGGGDASNQALVHLKYFTLYGSTQLTTAINMFRYCISLLLIRQLDTSHVTNMSSMFNYCDSLKALPLLDTSSVTNMSNMFAYAGTNVTTFNLNLSSWNVAKVTNMSNMFSYAGLYSSSFNLNLSNWNTVLVTDMSYMFASAGKNATTFTIDISGLNTAAVTTMKSMFELAGANASVWLISGLSNLNTGNVTTMTNMFNNACQVCRNAFTLDLSSWNISNLTDASYMFSSTAAAASSFDLNLSGWNTSKVTTTMFMFDAAGANAASFNINLNGWNTSNVRDMQCMFRFAGYAATSWSIGDLSSWNTSNVTNMSGMFAGAARDSIVSSWTIGDISNWNTSKVTNMNGMFNDAGAHARSWSIGTLSNWNTSSVTDMGSMFAGVGSNAPSFNLDLSNWNVSNVTDMRSMFRHAAHSATTWSVGNISNWNTSKVTNMNEMFKGASYSATDVSFGNLANWNVSNVTDMAGMFDSVGYKASNEFNLMLSNWDTSKVTDMTWMFYNCQKLMKIYVSNLWTVTNVVYSDDMFYGCYSIIGANGTSYDPSYIDKTYAKIDNSSNSGYLSPVYNITLKYNDGTTPDVSFKAISIDDLPTPTRAGYIFEGWYKFSSTTTTTTLGTNNFASTSNYKWTYNSSYGYWESTGNKGINNSVSVLKTNAPFSFIAGDKLSFKWRSNAESTFDYAAWNIWDAQNNKWLSGASSWGTSYSDSTSGLTPDSGLATTSGKQSSSTWTNNVYTFRTSGNYQIYWTYRKDSSASSGTDLAYVRDVVLTQSRTVIDDTPASALSEGLTLMAKWTAPSYTIIYVLNGGTGVSDGTYTVEDAVTLPTPTKTDYIFEGWYESSDFSSSKITSIPKGSSGNKTFYAKWYDNYTITYETNGGTLPSGAKTFYSAGESTSYALPTPTKTDYVFEGWYETSDFSGSKVTSIASGSTGNKTFYAKWYNNYAISYVLNGGTLPSDAKTFYSSGASYTLPTPTRTDYVFGGWYATSDFSSSKVTMISQGSSGNKTFYAKWIDPSYKLVSGVNFNRLIPDAMRSIVFTDIVKPASASAIAASDDGSVVGWLDGMVLYFSTQKTGQKVIFNENCDYMFCGNSSHNTAARMLMSADFTNADTSRVTSMISMFEEAGAYVNSENTISLDLSGLDVSNVTNMSRMFYLFANAPRTVNLNLSNWNTSNVTNMSYMFYNRDHNTRTLTLEGLSGWNVSKVTNMSHMFEEFGLYATNFSLDLSNWNTSKVTDMSYMFYDTAYNSTSWSIGDLSNWNTALVTNMAWMFAGVGYFASTFNLNLSGWNTSKVTDMNHMFSRAGLKAKTYNLNVSGWDTSSNTSLYGTFDSAGFSATSFSLNFSGWTTANVTNMNSTFTSVGASASNVVLDLSHWDTSKVTNMSSMFQNAIKLKTIYASSLWKTSKVSSSTNMFYGCTSLVGGNGTAYNSSMTSVSMARLDGVTGAGYLTNKAI